MRPRAMVLVGVVAVTALLSGCTGSGGEGGPTSRAVDEGSSPTALPTTGAVLAQQELAAPAVDSTSAPGGTMTVIVRSVAASKGTTVVSWAMRWDNPAAADGASVSLDKFLSGGWTPPVLTDGVALKLYYPLCPGGDWHTSQNADGCPSRALYSPRYHFSYYSLTNHQTFEAWAVFPGLDTNTKTVDLALPTGLPAFAALPVTRP